MTTVRAGGVRLATRAMATRFELVLAGDDPVRLRAAGEEALAEIRRLERQLSPFDPRSEVSRVNARAGREPVPVTPTLFRLLERARHLWDLTGGAFDPTVGPLMRCWGFRGGAGPIPGPEAIAQARARTGMDRVRLEDGTVAFETEGVEIDPGGIGKGFALEEAARLLRELGVPSALLHGGTSTVVAYGPAPDRRGWRVALDEVDAGPPVIVTLDGRALAVSAVHGRRVEAEGRTYGHVLDPRTGRPVVGARLAAVVTASATDADALATALLVLGADGPARLPDGTAALVDTGRTLLRHGL